MRALMTPRALAWLAGFQLALAATQARAQPNEESKVDVRCSALLTDPESAAALEARVLLELSLRKRQGNLLVDCSPETISLEWKPRDQAQIHRLELPLSPASSAADRVISSLDGLLRQSEKPETAPPLTTPARTEDERGAQLGLTLGGIAEFWDGPHAASLGLSVGLSLRGGRWRGALGVSGQTRIEDHHPVEEFRSYRGRGYVDYMLLPRPLSIEAGVGAALGNFRAATSEGFSPQAQTVFALALVYRLRLAWHSDQMSFAVGPEAAVNVVRPTIVLDGTEVSSLTPLSWGATADVYFWF